MATAAEVARVRLNTNEADDTLHDDTAFGELIEEHGVAGASAVVWLDKAAVYADLVNTSEAGASHSYSRLHEQALKMAAEWRKVATEESDEAGQEYRPRVHLIERQ